MTAADPRVEMLSELTESACRLGKAFAAEADRAPDWARRMEFFRLFDRCFFSVRVAIALQLRLERAPVEPREAASDREALIDRADPPDAEDHDRGYDERDRDRDRETEAASLPILLRTLHGVVADAALLPGPEPAALLTLRELLARVSAGQAAAPPTPPRSPPEASLRARLAGSATVPVLALARPPPAPRPFGRAPPPDSS
jgi:hypothetical protein